MDLHLDIPIENTPFMNASKKNNGAHCRVVSINCKRDTVSMERKGTNQS